MEETDPLAEEGGLQGSDPQIVSGRTGTRNPVFLTRRCYVESSVSKVTNQKWVGGLKGGDSRRLTLGYRLSCPGHFIFQDNKRDGRIIFFP